MDAFTIDEITDCTLDTSDAETVDVLLVTTVEDSHVGVGGLVDIAIICLVCRLV